MGKDSIKNKTLNLLSLCLQAQEKGYDIEFSNHMEIISIIQLGENKKIEKWLHVYTDMADVEGQFERVEEFLNGLISDVCTG